MKIKSLVMFMLMAFTLNFIAPCASHAAKNSDFRKDIYANYPSAKMLADLRSEMVKKFIGVESYIDTILMALLTKEHVFAFGGAGGCKTTLARKIADSKRFKGRSTTIQVNSSTRVEEVRGMPITEEVLKGTFAYETSDALVMYDLVVCDEGDKARPETFEALLSTLEERQLFLGKEKPVDGILKTAIITSNSSPYAVLNRFANENRLESGKAFFNRILFKVFVPNQSEGMDLFNLLSLALNKKIKDSSSQNIVSDDKIDLDNIYELIDDKLDNSQFDADLGLIITNLFSGFRDVTKQKSKIEKDMYKEDATSVIFPYTPTTLMSNRDILKAIKVIKAAVLLSFIKGERDDLKITTTDISALKSMFTLNLDPNLRSQLNLYIDDEMATKNIQDGFFERDEFDRVFQGVQNAHQERLKEAAKRLSELKRTK